MRIQTEIGLLPKDWKVRTLGEVAPLQRGFDLPSSELRKGPYPVVYSNGILNYHNVGPCIAPGLVTGRSGTIGKFTYIPEGRYWPHNTALWVTSFKNNCPLFVRYLFETVNFGAYSTGTGVPTLNRNDLHTCAIPLPPKPEQERIAAALTSIDSFIDNLERTIQKKKNIREGAMEELLSGKRRLPGFSGEWVEKKIEELYKFAKEGGTPSTSNPEFYNNASIPFAKIEDLNNHYLTKTENYINQNGIDHSSAWLVPSGSLLLSNGATLGEVTITAVPLATKQGILGVIVREQFSVEFLYYLLKTKDFKRKMEAITTHGTMDCAYLKDLKGIELYLPSDIHEQHAIADTLTALDDEIALLQAERDKYQQIRSGMMDDLLTGKIRLQ